jgi:hypothetical protein
MVRKAARVLLWLVIFAVELVAAVILCVSARVFLVLRGLPRPRSWALCASWIPDASNRSSPIPMLFPN